MKTFKKQKFDISTISYIQVGGIVEQYIQSDSLFDLVHILPQKFIAIGNTSKILFAFNYFNGCIVRYTLKKIVFFKDRYFIFSGTPLSDCFQELKKKNLSGFEKISTIPGWIGGSVYQNASFLNQSISDYLISVLVYSKTGWKILQKEECNFQYRSSSFADDILIVGAYFKNVYVPEKEQKKIHLDAIQYRYNHQKIYKKTLGSTFKNLPGIQIGKVLDQLGYKNYRWSNMVSTSSEHANFIKIEPKTNYLEISSFILFLKALLYYWLHEEVQLEISVIDAYGRNNDEKSRVCKEDKK